MASAKSAPVATFIHPFGEVLSATGKAAHRQIFPGTIANS
jgi:hypothetical protein